MTPEQQEQIHDLLGKGFGRHVIAREVGIGLGVARHYIDQVRSGPRKPSWWDQDNRVASLTMLWNEGKSARQIAAVMGCTRNVVIGKAHRLGLKARAVRVVVSPEERQRRQDEINRRKREWRSAGKPPRVRKRAAPKFKPVPYAPRPAPVEVAMPTNPPIRLADAPMHGICKHIAGEPNGPDTLFCGAESLPGQSWCAYHRLLLYRPREDRRQVYAFKESA